MKLYRVGYFDLVVAENKNMAVEIHKQNLLNSDFDIADSEWHVEEINIVNGYKIVPVGENVSDVLAQLVVDYKKDM